MSKKDVIAAINQCTWLRFSEKRILIGLWSFWCKSKKIYASYNYFADNWVMSHSSIKRGIKEFEHWDVIRIQNRNGSTNLIEFKFTETELISFLQKSKDDAPSRKKEDKNKNDNSNDSSDPAQNQNELPPSQNDPAQNQSDQGRGVKKNINTRTNTGSDIGDNPSSNTLTYTGASDINENNSISFDFEVKYDDEKNDDVKLFQELWKKHQSDVFEAFKSFQSHTNKLVVIYTRNEGNSNPFNIYKGESKTRATQTKFDRSKFLVLDSENFEEIVSHYE